MTLREFAHNYAEMIEGAIHGSFHYRSPKIDVNYDDYETKTLRPLNATIFYYFFSSGSYAKTMYSRNFAQWLLSSYRYPNERIRRAFMRAFDE